MESLSKYKCNEVGYAELAFQKKWLSQETTASKKVFLLKK